MPSPKNPGDRTKANRLRAAVTRGQKLQPIDALWLSDYDDHNGSRPGPKPAGAVDVGASRSGRKVKFEMEEQAEAVGSGSAAVAAASAALAAKEEGRRIDSLSTGAVDALKEACAVYKDICISMRERMEVLEATHVALLDSARDHYIARTEAETALMERDRDPEQDQATGMMMQIIAQKLGIAMPSGGRPAVVRKGKRE